MQEWSQPTKQSRRPGSCTGYNTVIAQFQTSAGVQSRSASQLRGFGIYWLGNELFWKQHVLDEALLEMHEHCPVHSMHSSSNTTRSIQFELLLSLSRVPKLCRPVLCHTHLTHSVTYQLYRTRSNDTEPWLSCWWTPVSLFLSCVIDLKTRLYQET